MLTMELLVQHLRVQKASLSNTLRFIMLDRLHLHMQEPNVEIVCVPMVSWSFEFLVVRLSYPNFNPKIKYSFDLQASPINKSYL